MKDKAIIVSAYAIYPDSSSSEGIVNRNWFDIIKEQDNNCHVLSSHKTIELSQKNWTTIESTQLQYLFRLIKNPKKSIFGYFLSVLNKIAIVLKLIPSDSNIYIFIWAFIQSKRIKGYLRQNPEVVFWGRILPSFSILPLLKVWEKYQFPLIINVNDPIVTTAIKQQSFEEEVFKKAISITQCWTFPSKALAERLAEKYQLDLQRCFVIPHAMKNGPIRFNQDRVCETQIRFVYTGTFYKSAFTDAFANDLTRFCNSEYKQSVSFTFILSQYDEVSLKWLKETIPDVQILTKLSREEVLVITEDADCMLVVDAASHTDLLKGKLMEAISQGLPVFGVTYKNSVMDKIVKEYGSFVAYQDEAGTIYDQMVYMTKSLNSKEWIEKFCETRKTVMDRVSEEKIAEATNVISEYASNRFLWKTGKINDEPIVPMHFNWP